jgi:hypothetical protein
VYFDSQKIYSVYLKIAAFELLDLPVELLLAIFARCSPCDLMRASRVCRYFNEIIKVHIVRLPRRPVDFYIEKDRLFWKMAIAISDRFDTIVESTVASQQYLSSNNAMNALGLSIVRNRVYEDDLKLVRTTRYLFLEVNFISL